MLADQLHRVYDALRSAQLHHVVSHAPHISRTPVLAHPLLSALIVARAAAVAAGRSPLARLCSVLRSTIDELLRLRDDGAVRALLVDRSTCSGRFTPLVWGLLLEDASGHAATGLAAHAAEGSPADSAPRFLVLCGRILLHVARSPEADHTATEDSCVRALEYAERAAAAAGCDLDPVPDSAAATAASAVGARVPVAAWRLPDVAVACANVRFGVALLRLQRGDRGLLAAATLNEFARSLFVMMRAIRADGRRRGSRWQLSLRFADRVAHEATTLLGAIGRGGGSHAALLEGWRTMRATLEPPPAASIEGYLDGIDVQLQASCADTPPAGLVQTLLSLAAGVAAVLDVGGAAPLATSALAALGAEAAAAAATTRESADSPSSEIDDAGFASRMVALRHAASGRPSP